MTNKYPLPDDVMSEAFMIHAAARVAGFSSLVVNVACLGLDTAHAEELHAKGLAQVTDLMSRYEGKDATYANLKQNLKEVVALCSKWLGDER